jgi:tetratricopeptide (TPR) repeat protein
MQGLPDRDLQPENREMAPAQMVSATSSSTRTDPRRDLAESAANTNVATNENTTSKANTTSSQKEVRDETSMLRASLAQRVSYELLSSPPYPASRAPESLEVPTGWGAIEQELKGHLERCDALLKRNAIMSARSEATSGLRRLCNAMDAHRRVLLSGPALEKAFIALREDADFQNLVGGGTFDSISSLVGSHTTEALKGRLLEGVSSEIASQHYRTYARYQFVVAADGHRWAAELLYAYGKTLEKEAELEPEKSFRLRSQSVACYQAAIQISPSQSEAASQLGYVLINLDRMDEAQRALMVSLQHRPTASAWNNMAELHRRLGAHADAQYAIQQASAIAQIRPSYTAEKPEITEVDAATFAKYSPVTPHIQTASASATVPASSPGARTASSPSFFSKIFTK